MLSRVRVITFYGICYLPDSSDAVPFRTLRRPTPAENGPVTPQWLLWHGYRKGRDGVELVVYGHHERPGYALAVEDTVYYGGFDEPLELCEWIAAPPDHRLLEAFCERHGLTWHRPRWFAVPSDQ